MTHNMDAFSFFCPTRLLFGTGLTRSVGAQVSTLGFRSVLLVSGSGATRKSAGFAALASGLDAAGVSYSVFDQVTPDPTAEVVAAAAAAILDGRHEAVVAYGGGSPIDGAKSAALVAANGVPMLGMVYGLVKPAKPALPVIAVPTTAGTGSEMSNAAVTTDKSTGRKLGFSSDSFFPRLAIIDPENHVTMPPGVTAATGMDALTHVVESYLSLDANTVCDAIDLHAVGLIATALPRAYENGTDIEARSAMAVASSTAGIAFSQTGLGMVHGFAHPVGAKFGIAHGTANAIILPYVLAALSTHAAPRLRDIAAALGVCSADASPEKGARVLVDAVVALKTRLGIAESLSGVGITLADAPALLPDALTYRRRPRSPRAFTDDELRRLLDAAISGDMAAAIAL
jgi:alcohol dehydrogenase class IV